MSAPTPRGPWEDPCGSDGAVRVDDGDRETSPRSTTDLLNGIYITAVNALGNAKMFREAYIRQTFNVDFWRHHKSWAGHRYDWLPEIPKALGENITLEKLEAGLDQWLNETNENLQRYSIGMEQVHWDMVSFNHEFTNDFKEVEDWLKNVLCEVHQAILERQKGNPLAPPQSREVMRKEYREQASETFRNLRDWIIFRDYMNCLEYIIAVCEYFAKYADRYEVPNSRRFDS